MALTVDHNVLIMTVLHLQHVAYQRVCCEGIHEGSLSFSETFASFLAFAEAVYIEVVKRLVACLSMDLV